EPERVEPGQPVHVTLTLGNRAATTFKNVRVTLNVSSPFVPIKGGSDKIISSIGPGESQTVTFDALAAPDAQSKAYRMPVTLKFQDNAGTSYTQEDGVGLQVGAAPDLDVQIDASTLLRPNTRGKITLKLVNRGTENLQFLSLGFLENPSYQTATVREQYIGSVASDDFETVDLDVYANQADPVVQVRVTFRDASNQPYERTYDVRVPTYTEEEITRFGLEPKAGLDPLVILAVLAVLFFAGRWAYGKWKKR
ncbi:MAG: hypothetical protein Q8P02_05120, partial [Candidatus Micrarchaeota archaeon]|nr:hypothetical protein [Candidatus Micrarchaeota archaeon]